MKKIFSYLKNYFSVVSKKVLLLSTLFTAAFIFINYHFKLNHFLYQLSNPWQYIGWYVVFLIAFSFAYCCRAIIFKESSFGNKKFVALLFIAPGVFAIKMTWAPAFKLVTDYFKNEYWNAVIYWPLKVVLMLVILWMIKLAFDKEGPLYGFTTKGFTAKPYVIMLLIMVPLIAAAATQKDFQQTYPHLKKVAYLWQPGTGWEKLLYELSYGTDFLSIEVFFRGFLVLAFARWVGKDAILPMAVFYCTIHFGKPLGECISSYFGGLILGVVAYETRSVIGGFVVHVGIAWLMDLGGYINP